MLVFLRVVYPARVDVFSRTWKREESNGDSTTLEGKADGSWGVRTQGVAAVPFKNRHYWTFRRANLRETRKIETICNFL